MGDNLSALRKHFLIWEWKDDSKMMHMFLHLLLSANNRRGEWRSLTVKRGQLITSRRRLLTETGMAESTIRSCLDRLEEMKAITMSPIGKYTVITICDYEKYAGSEDKK